MNIEKIISNLNKSEIKKNESMSNHTTFKAGGKCKVLFEPKTIDSLVRGIKIFKKEKIKFYIIGRGSNILFKDGIFDGVVVKISNNLNNIEISKNTIEVQAGHSLIELSKIVADKGLSGLEFAFGIPGTVGGAVTMNAGAYGGEIKDILKSITAINEKNEIITMEKDELKLSYRNSILSERDLIILSINLELKEKLPVEIKKHMDKLRKERNEKQPLGKPSAGSIFKRPNGHYAGKLIMDSGLAGFKIGGAIVSKKHCGFIVNDDKATSSDIIKLIDHVKEIVLKKYGVMLENEVKII